MAKTTITIPDDLFWRFKEEAPKRRLQDKDAAEEAIRLWTIVPDAAAIIGLMQDSESPLRETVLTAIERWKKSHQETPTGGPAGKKTPDPRAVNER